MARVMEWMNLTHNLTIANSFEGNKVVALAFFLFEWEISEWVASVNNIINDSKKC